MQSIGKKRVTEHQIYSILNIDTIGSWFTGSKCVPEILEQIQAQRDFESAFNDEGGFSMGVIQRFKDIMSANINAMLDKAEDPAKMIDQYIRNLETDLGNVKAETAAVMAEEKRAKRELDEAKAEVEKFQRYAQKAVAAGNDGDARTFLQQKNTVAEKVKGLQAAYDAAAANAQKMRQMHDKLTNDIASLNARRDAIKAKVAVAKTQEKLNKIGSSMNGVADHLSAFERMEKKADQMLDTANAMAELNESDSQSIDDLTMKYDMASDAHSDVDDELAALKAQMGMSSEN